jgi:hypothetical protein
MATIISPTHGNAPVYTQGGVGASPGYGALDFRRSDSAGPLQAGAMNDTDFKVVQRALGANMSVDITQNTTGQAMVRGGSIDNQGLYGVPCHATLINEPIAASHATLPRIDLVYLRVYDTAHDASGLNKAETVVSTGTPTATATKENGLGAVPLTGSVLLLAAVQVPAASTTVTTANILDRRQRCKGQRIVATAGAAALGSLDTSIVGEFSGTLVRLDWSIVVQHENNATAGSIKYGVYNIGQIVGDNEIQFSNLANLVAHESGFHVFAPGAGYKTFILRVFEVTGSTWDLKRASFMATELI